MYDLRFMWPDPNELTGQGMFVMNPDHGVLVNTIKGLTSLAANIAVSARSDGYGEVVYGDSIKGRTMTIEGVIPDNNKAKKNEMLVAMPPAKKGWIRMYTASFQNPPQKLGLDLDCIIKEAPEISQDTHSKFSVTIYAPNPYWRKGARTTVSSFTSGTGKAVVNAGNVKTEYTLTFRTNGSCTSLVLSFKGQDLTLNFDPALTANTEVVFGRKETGRVYLTIGGVEHNECIDLAETDLWFLPPNTTSEDLATITVSGTGASLRSSSLKFYERYSGVNAWGEL